MNLGSLNVFSQSATICLGTEVISRGKSSSLSV
jgi:hypothetical protein